MPKNYLFELPNLGLISCEGQNPSEFLQGQLSCDLREVTTSTLRQGALCSVKGKILALVDTIFWKECFNLVLPSNLIEATIASLSKVALLSRIRLSERSDYVIYGFHLNDLEDILPKNFSEPLKPLEFRYLESYCYYCVTPNFYLLITEGSESEIIAQPFKEKGQLRDAASWHYLQLQQQRVQIYPETRGAFFPHRLNLHINEFISFTKGCYKGQEIIARMHYLGKNKYILKSFTLETEEKVFAGQKIYTADLKQEIGEVLDLHQLDYNRYFIVISFLIEHPTELRFEHHRNIVPELK